MDVEKEVMGGGLYHEVVQTETRCFPVAHPAVVVSRRLALLCWALERSANGAIGTSINLAGTFRALAELRAGVSEPDKGVKK
jgi:hypothetical protein